MFIFGILDVEVLGSDSILFVIGIGNILFVIDSGSYIIINKFNSDSLIIRMGIYVGNDYWYDKIFSE